MSHVSSSAWNELNDQIIQCRRCPRLVDHCRRIAVVKRKAYLDQEYWGRPVANLGRPDVPLLIVGLAPGAHGANRTGRMFTGDRSGEWLYAAMHKAGFCNQPTSIDAGDGLQLYRCAITAVCHCAPPDNKPNTGEIRNCRNYLEQTIQLTRPKFILALGGIAWKVVAKYAIEQEWINRPTPKFGHAAAVALRCPDSVERWLLGSYHPSQQNTFTGKLTRQMLDELFAQLDEQIGH